MILLFILFIVLVNIILLVMTNQYAWGFAQKPVPKPVVPLKPGTRKPVAQPKPVAHPKPVVRPKPVAQPKPVAHTPIISRGRKAITNVNLGKPPSSKGVYTNNGVKTPVSVSTVQVDLLGGNTNVQALTVGGVSAIRLYGNTVYGTIQNGKFVSSGQKPPPNSAIQQVAKSTTGQDASAKTAVTQFMSSSQANLQPQLSNPKPNSSSGSSPGSLTQAQHTAALSALLGLSSGDIKITGIHGATNPNSSNTSQKVSIKGQSATVSQGASATFQGKAYPTLNVDGQTFVNTGGTIHYGNVINGTFVPSGTINKSGQLVSLSGRAQRGASPVLASMATGAAIGATMGGPAGAAVGAAIGAAGGALYNFLMGDTGKPPVPTSGNKPPVPPSNLKPGVYLVGGKPVQVTQANGVFKATHCIGPSQRDDISYRYQPSAPLCTGPMGNTFNLNQMAQQQLQHIAPGLVPAPPVDHTLTATFLQTMVQDYWAGRPNPVTGTINVLDSLGIHNPFAGHDTARLDQQFRTRYMDQVAMNTDYYTLSPQQRNMVDSIFLGVSPQLYAQTNNMANTPTFQQGYQALANTFGLHYPLNTPLDPLANIVPFKPDPSDAVVPGLDHVDMDELRR